jgi:hypothetical protein
VRRAALLGALGLAAALAAAGCSTTDTAIGELLSEGEAAAVARQARVVDGYCVSRAPEDVRDRSGVEPATRAEAEAAVDALADTLRAKPDAVYDSPDENRSRRVLRTDLETMVRVLSTQGTPCDPELGARLQRAIRDVGPTTTGG